MKVSHSSPSSRGSISQAPGYGCCWGLVVVSLKNIICLLPGEVTGKKESLIGSSKIGPIWSGVTAKSVGQHATNWFILQLRTSRLGVCIWGARGGPVWHCREEELSPPSTLATAALWGEHYLNRWGTAHPQDLVLLPNIDLLPSHSGSASPEIG